MVLRAPDCLYKNELQHILDACVYVCLALNGGNHHEPCKCINMACLVFRTQLMDIDADNWSVDGFCRSLFSSIMQVAGNFMCSIVHVSLD